MKHYTVNVMRDETTGDRYNDVVYEEMISKISALAMYDFFDKTDLKVFLNGTYDKQSSEKVTKFMESVIRQYRAEVNLALDDSTEF